MTDPTATSDDLTFAFSGATLQAPSLLDLIGNTHELRLVVTEADTYMEGMGYRHDIQGVFTQLVFDWEARTRSAAFPKLPPGEYYFDRRGERLVIGLDSGFVPLEDGAATVELVVGEKEED